jgi:hypothetical protein
MWRYSLNNRVAPARPAAAPEKPPQTLVACIGRGSPRTAGACGRDAPPVRNSRNGLRHAYEAEVVGIRVINDANGVEGGGDGAGAHKRTSPNRE